MTDLDDSLIERLISESLPPDLARSVVTELRPEARATLALEPSIVDSPLLDLRAPLIESPEAVVVFAFGNRIDAEGGVHPGPVNEHLAALADSVEQALAIPVIAQWEVADEMTQPAQRVGVVIAEDGSVEYLSTLGVAEQARDVGLGAEPPFQRVAVLAMADHAVRCCRMLGSVGFDAGVVDQVELPSEYDADSGQPWTRNRATYLAVDLLARCLN